MKLNQVKVRVISEGTAGALEASVNAFLASIGEATYVEMRLAVAAGAFVMSIHYTT